MNEEFTNNENVEEVKVVEETNTNKKDEFEKILQKIIRDYSHTLYFVSINDSECIQHQDYIGLPDDISNTINKVIEKMEYIGLPLTLEAIHIGMSLEMNASFKDEFGVNDDTFKMIIERNCTLTPVHRWDRNVFREVRE